MPKVKHLGQEYAHRRIQEAWVFTRIEFGLELVGWHGTDVGSESLASLLFSCEKYISGLSREVLWGHCRKSCLFQIPERIQFRCYLLF